jgi:hypothetical protein
MSTSVYKNNKYLDITKFNKYYRDLVDGKIILENIKEEDPEYYKENEEALKVSFNRARLGFRRLKPEVTWIYRDAGSGKTEWARNYLKDYDSLTVKNEYYEGLEGKPYLLYDDINPVIQDIGEFKCMLYELKCHLNTKYGEFNFLYEKVCITSCLNPLEYIKLFPQQPQHAIFWRIDRIIHCTHDKTTNTFDTEEMKEEDFYDGAEEFQLSNNPNKRFKYE